MGSLEDLDKFKLRKSIAISDQTQRDIEEIAEKLMGTGDVLEAQTALIALCASNIHEQQPNLTEDTIRANLYIMLRINGALIKKAFDESNELLRP